MWQQQPTLRYGMIHYNAVPCDSPQVFAVLRTRSDDRLLSLLNVGPHRQTITISLPVDTLELAEGDYALYDLLEGGARAEEEQRHWRRDELLALKLTLEPFGAYCFALRPADDTDLLAPSETPANQQPAPLTGDTPGHKNGGRERAVAEEQTASAMTGARRPRRQRTISS
jgi:hypothetical protein